MTRVLVITSCTGSKRVQHPRRLELADFRQGAAHVAAREAELAALLTPAEQLYSGQQHLRLLRGLARLRAQQPDFTVDLRIVSAGYGLVAGDRPLAPYEATFNSLGRREAQAWARTLDLPAAFRAALSDPFDLAVVLLGDEYLRAVELDATLAPAGHVLLVCGATTARKLPSLPNVRVVPLAVDDTRRFGAGLAALKGEVGGRLLELLARDPAALATLRDPASDVLALLASTPPPPPERTPTRVARPHPAVDRVVELPDAWWRRPHKQRLAFFLPDWDDHLDPDFDFEAEEHANGVGDWSNEAYAHQFFPSPPYDGILISKIGAERGARKRERINRLGVHRYLRVPPAFPVMGDCGAFGYVQEETPPYTTDEILDYYTRLGFDLGVSIDHLIVSQVEAQRRFRYELTIANAEAFLREHRARGLRWTPVGAVQGWDPASYAHAAAQYVAMGYDFIALGGLVRSSTPDILRVVAAVHEVVPPEVRVHLFGIARLDATREFVRLGVTSMDSASLLRKAWLGSNANYLARDGWYTAIRVPQASGSFRGRRVVSGGQRSQPELEALERRCLDGLRAHARGSGTAPAALLDALVEYDALVAAGGLERRGQRERIRRTLDARPWEHCGCAICARWGIEAVIFRGNNRNRRRGFHNTWVFFELLDQLFTGPPIPWLHERTLADLPAPAAPAEQLALFGPHD